MRLITPFNHKWLVSTFRRACVIFLSSPAADTRSTERDMALRVLGQQAAETEWLDLLEKDWIALRIERIAHQWITPRGTVKRPRQHFSTRPFAFRLPLWLPWDCAFDVPALTLVSHLIAPAQGMCGRVLPVITSWALHNARVGWWEWYLYVKVIRSWKFHYDSFLANKSQVS